jgi:hypothetical protein
MKPSKNIFLIIAASLSALAALFHIACIIFGGPMYLLMGAGSQMAHLADAGHWYPTVVTSFIASILFIWSLYALSGAGVIRRLPLLRFALCAITAIYLARSVAFVALMPHFPENSPTFWFWSSAICFVFGLMYFIGTWQVWAKLKNN